MYEYCHWLDVMLVHRRLPYTSGFPTVSQNIFTFLNGEDYREDHVPRLSTEQNGLVADWVKLWGRKEIGIKKPMHLQVNNKANYK